MAGFVFAVLLLSLCSINCCRGESHDLENEVMEKVDITAGEFLKATTQGYPSTNSTSARLQQLEALVKLLSEELSNARVDQEIMRLDLMAHLEAINEKLKDHGPSEGIEDLMATYMKDFRPVQNNTKVSKVHADCRAALRDGWKQSGLYMVSPDGGTPMEVFCDQKSSGGGWIVVQKRLDGQVDFDRSWEDYKHGFGELHGDFWLGNENLHRLTARINQKLRVELHHHGHGYAYAEYSSFMISNEQKKYKLHIGGYTGINSPGDSLMYHNNQFFSAPDVDNDADCTHCAAWYGAGWWFKNCSKANLNGVYGSTSEKGITWSSWMGSTTSLTSVKMMVKPADEDFEGSKNCQDVYNSGGTASGVYTIYLNGTDKVQVFCEQKLQGGGWTVFQRRMDGSVDFYLGWADYKWGFGKASGEYWLGNDNLHTLTANQDTELMVELEQGGETQYVKYTEFWLANEDKNYMLHISGYSEGRTAGDSLVYPHNDRPFTTRDRDNDEWSDGNCAQQASGAWWYNKCYRSNLNGLYAKHSTKGVIWYTWKGWFTPMSAVRMMLKTKI